MAAVILHTLPPLFHAEVLSRPSKQVKSPYLADVKLIETGEEGMAHCPALGCMGLISPGAVILVSKMNQGSTAKSSYVVHHVVVEEPDSSTHLVGTHPMTANILARSAMEGGLIIEGAIEKIEKEKTIAEGGSRFDFVVTHTGGKKTIVEVKNVPCADYSDGNKREKKSAQSVEGLDHYAKMAIFPEGFRKKSTVRYL